jgi:hypothetical protein
MEEGWRTRLREAVAINKPADMEIQTNAVHGLAPLKRK